MEKIARAGSRYRSIFHRSRGYVTTSVNNQLLAAARRNSHLSTVPKRISPDSRFPFLIKMNIGSTRSFSEDVTHMPTINDPEIKIAIKDLLAADWSEIPSAVVSEANKALSKSTEDKSGQETLKNVLLAAEAVEEFTGKLVSLRMEIDDSVGLSGEDVKPLPDIFAKALLTAFQRYNAYLDAFKPDETFIRKKVENELGTRMIHLKMRCGGLGSEWGKCAIDAGISAYPFSRERAAELESDCEYIKTLKLDMLLDPRTSFTQENGSKVKLSKLTGKRIIFLIKNGWVTQYPTFWRRLKARYRKMKNTDDAFEVIHAPYVYVGSSYGEYVGTVPWLRHRPFRLNSKKYTLLQSVFRRGVGLLAFDHDGRVVRKTKNPSIEKGNKDFPFYTGGLVKEALKDLVQRFDWDY